MTPKNARIALSLALCALVAISAAYFCEREEAAQYAERCSSAEARAAFAEARNGPETGIGRLTTSLKIYAGTIERENARLKAENESLRARLDSIERGSQSRDRGGVIPAGTHRNPGRMPNAPRSEPSSHPGGR